jgi:hypothetical protein
MTIVKFNTYSIHICEKELNHLRDKHPQLLNQAYSYGYEYGSSEHHFYHQPKLMVDNLKAAIQKLYQPYKNGITNNPAPCMFCGGVETHKTTCKRHPST